MANRGQVKEAKSMRVRCTDVLEATQITEEMVRDDTLLPPGVRLGQRMLSGRNVEGYQKLLNYTLRVETTAAGDSGPDYIFIGQWFVRNDEFSGVVDCEEFHKRYEEVHDG